MTNDTDNADDDLKRALTAHLDDALPTPAERRLDLARSGIVSRPMTSRLRLAAAALLGAAAFGAVNIGRVLLEPSLASNGDVALTIIDRDHASESPLRLDGSRAVYVRGLRASFSSHALPSGLGEQLVRMNDIMTTGTDVLNTVAQQVPGLLIDVDSCVDHKSVDVYANSVPADAFIDAFIEKLALDATVNDGVLTVRCRNTPPGALGQLAAGRAWPPIEALLARRVQLHTGDAGMPLDEAVAALGRESALPVDYRPSKKPPVVLHVENVQLATMLAVLTDSSGLLVTIDPRKNTLVVIER